MSMNIFFSFLGIIIYWQTGCLFTTYCPKCLSSRFYFTVSNRHIYNMFSGGFRGMHKVPAEDRNKFAVMGIMTYIVLLPCALAFICFMWKRPENNKSIFWLCYFFAVIFINLLDEAIGQVVYFIKVKK